MSSLPPLNGHDPASLWQRFRELLWYDEPLGVWLDVSRMGLEEHHLDALTPLFERAFAAMAALEAGAIANPDEQRQVGHYWLRDPELAPDPAAGQHIAAEVDRLETFGAAVREGRITAPGGAPFTDVLWIGIGGSGLGPLLILRALGREEAGLPFHFLDNVDPQGIHRTLSLLGERLRTTLVVVVSKSGGTPEPRLGMEQARARLEAAGGTWPAQAVAITMGGSQLDGLAESQGWLARFDMFDWVGGRTSITSAVGLLPAALTGADLRGFLAGAVEPLAQRLHHQLLQVAAEHLQPVAVGQQHHVPLPFAVACHVPGCGHEGGRVSGEIGESGGPIHHGGTIKKGPDIGAD